MKEINKKRKVGIDELIIVIELAKDFEIYQDENDDNTCLIKINYGG